MRFFAACIAAVQFTALATARELLEPVPVLVDGKPLDVEQMGHAAPFVGDFDRDGLKDLLVGEFYKGRLRIYRNIGTNKEPQFGDFTLFQNGKRSGCIHSSCCMGFAPQVVDFDGDGQEDVLSGNWIFEVILFRGLGNGAFAAGEAVESRDGRSINIGYGVTPFAVDWDSDGDLDILAGTVEHEGGNVYLVRNEGRRSRYEYGKPEKLLAGGAPIEATDGGAAPVAADWDQDGKLDLILGCGDGSVRWYRNGGSSGIPELSTFAVLVQPAQKGDERGHRSKPCVVDWNEDGRLDLLVGDVGERFEKELSDEEEAWREQARNQQASFLKDWSRVFSRYRSLMATTSSTNQVSPVKDSEEITLAREEMARLNAVRKQYYEEAESLKPGTHTHGRVWLFLRAGLEADAVAVD